MSISTLGFAGLEAALNQYIALDPAAQTAFAKLHGRVIGLELTGPGIRFYLLPAPDGIRVLQHYEGAPDCLLQGSPMALVRMGGRRASTEQLFSGDVRIEGNTATAHQFGKILSAIDIDWEEQLSKITGDILAHKLGNLFRSMGSWGSHARNTLALDIEEYLKEEQQLLPDRTETSHFADEIDRLRDDVERLQARLTLLRDSAGDSSA